jgi:hypothetical protein
VRRALARLILASLGFRLIELATRPDGPLMELAAAADLNAAAAAAFTRANVAPEIVLGDPRSMCLCNHCRETRTRLHGGGRRAA